MVQRNLLQIKTYTLNHNVDVSQFLYSIQSVQNSMISNIWSTIVWTEKLIKNSKQVRILPKFVNNKVFKKYLRDKYLVNWQYSNHWVDSSIKVAYSILKSWKSNYINGDRKATKPVVKRLFVRVKQTLMKIENNTIRISIKPNEFIYIPIDKRYFKINSKIGEPILTTDKIHIPITTGKIDKTKASIGWDMNVESIDGFSPEKGWIKLDTRPLQQMHQRMIDKRRNLNILSKSKKGRIVRGKYRHRERNRAKQMTN